MLLYRTTTLLFVLTLQWMHVFADDPVTLTFPRDDSVEDYVMYNGPNIQAMWEFTACFWVTPEEALTKQYPVSYATDDYDKAILFQINSATDFKVYINNEAFTFTDFNFQLGVESHICIDFEDEGNNRKVGAFQNGAFLSQQIYTGDDIDVPANGTLVFAQKQDVVGPSGFSASQTFVGVVKDFVLWPDKISGAHINLIYTANCDVTTNVDYELRTDFSNIEVHGQATATKFLCPFLGTCSPDLESAGIEDGQVNCNDTTNEGSQCWYSCHPSSPQYTVTMDMVGADNPVVCENNWDGTSSWVGTAPTCDAISNIFGDPHVVTFDGLRFGFQEANTYLLVGSKAKGGEDFFRVVGKTVQIKSKQKKVARLKNATIEFVHPDHGKVSIKLEAHHSGLTAKIFNVEDTNTVQSSYADSTLQVTSSDDSITVRFNKITVEWKTHGIWHAKISVSVPPKYHSKVKGLMGNDNRNRDDDFKHSGRKLTDEAIAFINKNYKVSPSDMPSEEGPRVKISNKK